ncbi:hypothetical protein [Nocardiopsis sp. NRRL B-16309]|uniref:hypothetical protein n=1 Tax=Nocardiopsis sp. NRRL B-16309 TaxID=1519494 RepID=UPI000B2F1ED3|nr:hypothetical protein [Nocardiopsis sp. NRRL B-16309]
MPKYELGFYEGVKERDIPNLPEHLKEPFIYKLQELASGKEEGQPLHGKSFKDRGCRKVPLTSPEMGAKLLRNREKGRDPNSGLGDDVGYRIVFRKGEVRGKKVIVIVAVGPRKGFKAYKSAEHRLVKNANSKKMPSLTSSKKPTPRAPAQEPTKPTPQRASGAQTGRTR